eukprot:TRINITY_DN6017_c0_g1_i1.p1 TRINITY_DN6017_c0_g1~~TRINITY_DN6017_c0_g1_i1.p1  ORF type:complete len:443 (+),score=98.50 TRINITY_DN6017_c0_g1_i1:95-1330(+)
MAQATVFSPTRTAGKGAADLAHELDARFRSHPKFSKSHSVFASQTDRFKQRLSVGPSPAQYQATVAAAPASARSTSSFRSTTPRMGFHSREALLHPSPGQYNVPHGAFGRSRSTAPQRAPSVAFGSSRPQREKGRVEQTPGPQSYHGGPQSPGVSVDASAPGKSPRTGASERGSPAFQSTVHRIVPAPVSAGPPPTAYAPEVGSIQHRSLSGAQSGTSASFTSGTDRFKPMKPKHFSEGMVFEDHRSITKRNTGRTFPRVDRFVPKAEDTPGPGTYEVAADTFVDTTQSADLTAVEPPRNHPVFRSKTDRFYGQQRSLTPGPGSYHNSAEQPQPVEKASSVFTSRTPRVVHKAKPTPEPGRYNVDGHTIAKSVKRRSKAATFASSEERFKARVHDTPGPGHTNLVYSSFLH